MLKLIQIQGFQAHTDTEIELDPGLNVIVGESDMGKSSIIRSLMWLNYNRPRGDGFRNDDLKPKEPVTVCEVFDDDSYVVREKAKGLNCYQLPDSEEPLQALNTDVPDEVKAITRIHPVNIQSQHPSDQYFMLTEKSGQVARMFNEVTDLTVMDRAMSEINGRTRSAKAELKFIDNEITSKENEVKSLEWVDAADDAMEDLFVCDADVQSVKKEITIIENLLSQIDSINEELEPFENLDNALKELQALVSLGEEFDQLSQYIEFVDEKLKLLDTIESELNAYADPSKALNALRMIESATADMTTAINRFNSLESLLVTHREFSIDIACANKEVKDVEAQFHEILKTEACPFCGRKA